ncbi:imelysin family protein [Chryseolinea sp. T2]|uniref:imelysin family protein n=1 Tax=Chryseolinea sp. T2 TaxID=3129255 RepID=UPI003077C4CE
MKNTYTKVLAVSTLMLFAACNDDNENGSSVDVTLNTAVLDDFSAAIAQATYNDLAAKTTTLYSQVLELAKDGATNTELDACRATWKSARQAWEQSESFLFGPVSTDNIDPRIDTWPVNFTDLDAQLNSDNEFTEAYIDDLEDALKGFHPIEYLIFGENGAKTAEQLSARDIEYLKGLALNLKSLTSDLDESWDPSSSGNYHTIFTTAGSGNSIYPTQAAAFEELVIAMAGICDEVANGKIGEVYAAQDPTLEESPFAKNSITDFTNNIKGVQNVYLGKYAADGRGLEDMVRAYNLGLDNDVKLKMSTAIEALGKITVPFGEAIKTQKTQVQNAIDAIKALQATLEEELLPFVKLHSN